MIDHVGIYGSRVAEGVSAFNVGLVLGVRGWAPVRHQQDLTWNHTVNLSGGAGHCLEMDLDNEFCNRDFKAK